MRNQYVNITRARDEIKIFTDDTDSLKELAGIKTHARDTLDVAVKADEVADKMARLARDISAALPAQDNSRVRFEGPQLEL